MYEEYLSKALSNAIMARQALHNYHIVKQKDLKNMASYHAQQAIELILKYSIYNNTKYNNNSSNYKPIFTHDLDRLIKQYCLPYGINVPNKIKKNAKMYSTWEAESRYSLHYSVREDSILAAINEVELWLIQLKPAYKAKIENVKTKLDMK
jgi:HEPN domain-containing protein